jgi:hypothetical protein
MTESIFSLVFRAAYQSLGPLGVHHIVFFIPYPIVFVLVYWMHSIMAVLASLRPLFAAWQALSQHFDLEREGNHMININAPIKDFFECSITFFNSNRWRKSIIFDGLDMTFSPY